MATNEQSAEDERADHESRNGSKRPPRLLQHQGHVHGPRVGSLRRDVPAHRATLERKGRKQESLESRHLANLVECSFAGLIYCTCPHNTCMRQDLKHPTSTVPEYQYQYLQSTYSTVLQFERMLRAGTGTKSIGCTTVQYTHTHSHTQSHTYTHTHTLSHTHQSDTRTHAFTLTRTWYSAVAEESMCRIPWYRSLACVVALHSRSAGCQRLGS